MYSKNTQKISLVLFSIGMLLVYSCRENAKTENESSTTQTETTVETKVTPVTSSDGVTLNPAHGQPGHRCDIKVGAPLDSAPDPVNTSSQGSDVFLDSEAALPPGTLNPPHGQAGHRCDIKVGEPLK